MPTSGGNPGDQRPTVFKVPGESITRNLRQLYIRLLKLVIQYRNEFWLTPTVGSAAFYQYLKENGVTHISHEKLQSAILYMEEFYYKALKERGKDPHFLDSYLEERFQLGKQIWGIRLEDHNQEEDQDDDPEEFDDVVEDEKQDFKDLAILKSIINFRLSSGVFPEADSHKLYYLFSRVSIKSIRQDEFVDRILIMEENFYTINNRKVLGDPFSFRNSRREEIHNMSNWIWGYRNDYSDAADDFGDYDANFDDDFDDIDMKIEDADVDDEDQEIQDVTNFDDIDDIDMKIEDADVDDEDQEIQDVTILRYMHRFIRRNKFTPSADSKEFYDFVKLFNFNITQQKLVSRLRFLKANFFRKMGSSDTDFRNSRRWEIHNLSQVVWADTTRGRKKKDYD